MEDVSVVSLVVRVVVSLGVVLAVMAGAAAVLKRGGFGGAAGGGIGRSRTRQSVEVLGRVTLGRNASVTVVRVGSRALVLGVSDQNVTLLTETDPAELAALHGSSPGGSSLVGGAPTPPAAGASSGMPSVDPESPGTAAPGGFPPASSAWKAVVEQLRDRTVRR